MICDHYNTVHVIQYCPEDGALFITEYNDYLDSAHVFKSIKLYNVSFCVNFLGLFVVLWRIFPVIISFFSCPLYIMLLS